MATTSGSKTKNWTELKPKGKGPKGLDWSGIYPSSCVVWTDKSCREIDEEAFRELLRDLMKYDIAGLGVTLTHEGLTLKERLRAVKIGKEESKGRLSLRAGATGEWTLQVIEEAKIMVDAGIDVLYLHPTPIGEYEEKFLVDHFKRFDKAVRTPFFIMCGPPKVSASTLKRIAIECENLVGYKIPTSHDFWVMNAVIDALKEAEAETGRHVCPIIAGVAGDLAFALMHGAEGNISGGGVWRVKEDVEVFKAVKRGDYTQAIAMEKKLAPANNAQHGAYKGGSWGDLITRYKIFAWLMGKIPRPYARPPFVPMSKEEILLLREALIKSELKVVREAKECEAFDY